MSHEMTRQDINAFIAQIILDLDVGGENAAVQGPDGTWHETDDITAILRVQQPDGTALIEAIPDYMRCWSAVGALFNHFIGLDFSDEENHALARRFVAELQELKHPSDVCRAAWKAYGYTIQEKEGSTDEQASTTLREQSSAG